MGEQTKVRQLKDKKTRQETTRRRETVFLKGRHPLAGVNHIRRTSDEETAALHSSSVYLSAVWLNNQFKRPSSPLSDSSHEHRVHQFYIDGIGQV